MRNALLIVFGIAIMTLIAGVALAGESNEKSKEGLKCKGEENKDSWGTRPGRGESADPTEFNGSDYKGYEEDPLYIKLVELGDKLHGFAKEANKKIEEIRKKYGDVNDLTDEEKKAMQEEIMAVMLEKKQLYIDYESTKAALDEKIAKDREIKYKDDPLYKKMQEAKAKFFEAQKNYSEFALKMNGKEANKWNEMTPEEQQAYKDKRTELSNACTDAREAFVKAKKAFLKKVAEDIQSKENKAGKKDESSDSDTDKKDSDTDKKENETDKKEVKPQKKNITDNIQELHEQLKSLKAAFDQMMAKYKKQLNNMTDEQKKSYSKLITELMTEIDDIERKINELVEKAK